MTTSGGPQMTDTPLPRIDSLAALRDRLRHAAPTALPDSVADRARDLLRARIDAAERQAIPLPQMLTDIASGAVAVEVAGAARRELADTAMEQAVACAPGCAFCCLVPEGDGGLLTQSEAEGLHAALAPHAGQPDGRAWHPDACAALDPATRLCRAYDARPNICRAFFSFDAGACRIIAAGGDADGSAITGDHLDYLAALALSRALLGDGVATFSLSALTAATMAGLPRSAALDAARHDADELDLTCEDFFYDVD